MSRIRIEKKGITNAGTECIVNAANEYLQGGSGVCGAIFKAAGWDQLQAACNLIGHCDTGDAVITPAFNLNAGYIIHAVGPVWQDGKHKEPQKLYSCYQAALSRARELKCHSIAFPLISAGIYGYPKEKAWRKALQACNDFIENNPAYDMDILFTVLDDQILQIGMEELKKQTNSRAEEPKPAEKRTFPVFSDDQLLEKLKGKALKKAIEGVRKSEKISWFGGKTGEVTIGPYPEYPEGFWDSFSVLEPDQQYMEHYIQDCAGMLPSEMDIQQVRAALTYISRGEHFSQGFAVDYLEDKTLLKLLLRLDDLLIRYYEKHRLPADARFNNPVFWYEKNEDNTPVLVKGNGERLSISETNSMFEKTAQMQQGWQRSMLYMEYDNIWDATSFAATMNATLACGPDDKGRVFTFTSCEEADRSVYEYLTFDQVAVCRKNVEDFYADPKTQMRWKDVILHPVSLILREDGSLEPVAISKLNPSILDRYEKTSVCIGDRESYNWIFEK